MKRAALRLSIFLIVLSTIILLIKGRAMNGNVVKGHNSFSDKTKINKDTSYYFIGSSRVECSIVPEIIETHFENINVFNFGISSGTFLSNCIVSDYLIQQKGHKVLFIELSPRLNELPIGLFEFTSEFGVNPFTSFLRISNGYSFSEKIIVLINILNNYIFSSVSLKKDIKSLISYDEEKSKIRNDLASSAGKNYLGTSSFLTYEEIKNKSINLNLLSKYLETIEYLKSTANTHNTQLVFFLPINYIKQTEKDIVIPLYNSLPNEIKLEFPKYFFEQITKSEYLTDPNHLNLIGASAYSELLIPSIEKKVNSH